MQALWAYKGRTNLGAHGVEIGPTELGTSVYEPGCAGQLEVDANSCVPTRKGFREQMRTE